MGPKFKKKKFNVELNGDKKVFLGCDIQWNLHHFSRTKSYNFPRLIRLFMHVDTLDDNLYLMTSVD